MKVVVGVISPAPAWVMPRRYVDQLRGEFPQHTFLDAWDRAALRRLLPEADAAFTPFVDRDIFRSLTRLRWVQSPAAGVGALMFPELLASGVVITSARGIRARSIAEHVLGVTIALARRLPAAMRAQQQHRWAQEELEGPDVDVRTLHGQRMGIVGLGSIGRALAGIASPFGFRKEVPVYVQETIRRGGARRVHRGAARSVEPVLGSAERDRHAARLGRAARLLDAARRALRRQSPPVRAGRAAAERRRQDRRLLTGR